MVMQGNIQIALVDNNAADRALFKNMLNHLALPVTVTLYESAQSLLEVFNTSSQLPDILLVDFNMPHQSGLELLTILRQDALFDELPIVIYASDLLTIQIDATFAAGANYYMVKAMDVEKTRMMLCWVIGHLKDVPSRETFLLTEKQFPYPRLKINVMG